MVEPDVTLTDYLLTGQGFCFAILIYRKLGNTPWLLLFASLGAASFFGGTVHGFVPDESSTAYGILWRSSLLAIGGVALAGGFIGADLLQNRLLAAWIKRAAIGQGIFFAALITLYSQKFLWAALNYLPAALLLLVGFTHSYRKTRQPALLWGIVGILLTFVASFVQIARIPLHRVYFNHNALYHAIQFMALCLLFMTAKNSGERKTQARS